MSNQINFRFVAFLGVTATLGGLLFGFDISIITGAGPFLIRHFKLDDLSLGWAFSSLLFGCIVGSVIAGRLTDLAGRRKILLGVALLFAATTVATGLAPTFRLFILARFLGGLAVGGASIVSPMYVAEVSPAVLRGRLCAFYQLSITLGILVSYCINYLFMAFIAFFAACIGPVFWTLVPEIFPNRVRGTAMIVPVLTQWAANAAAVLFFPVAFNQIGKAPTFAFLGLMALTQALFTWRFVPETRNKTLEEIEEQWRAGAAKPR